VRYHDAWRPGGLRDLAYVPTNAEARYIGERHGEIGAAYGWRVAYLASEGAQFGVARMVEILSGFRGAAARVFSTEAEALAWLREAAGGEDADSGGRLA
jgi:hypothetical protein